jgi:hypothetical protein
VSHNYRGQSETGVVRLRSQQRGSHGESDGPPSISTQIMDDRRRLWILRSNIHTIGLPGAARPSPWSRCSGTSKTVNHT